MEFNKSTTAFLACHWQNDVGRLGRRLHSLLPGTDGGARSHPRREATDRQRTSVGSSCRLRQGRVRQRRTATWSPTSRCFSHGPTAAVLAGRNIRHRDHRRTRALQAEDWVITNTKVSAFASSDLDEATARRGHRHRGPVRCRDQSLRGAAPGAPPGTWLPGRHRRRRSVKRRPTGPTRQASESFALLGEVATTDEVLAAL